MVDKFSKIVLDITNNSNADGFLNLFNGSNLDGTFTAETKTFTISKADFVVGTWSINTNRGSFSFSSVAYGIEDITGLLDAFSSFIKENDMPALFLVQKNAGNYIIGITSNYWEVDNIIAPDLDVILPVSSGVTSMIGSASFVENTTGIPYIQMSNELNTSKYVLTNGTAYCNSIDQANTPYRIVSRESNGYSHTDIYTPNVVPYQRKFVTTVPSTAFTNPLSQTIYKIQGAESVRLTFDYVEYDIWTKQQEMGGVDNIYFKDEKMKQTSKGKKNISINPMMDLVNASAKTKITDYVKPLKRKTSHSPEEVMRGFDGSEVNFKD